ncbi:MAG TPA: hypothetical protein VIJ95_16825 [Hanamia sp.]
MSKLEFVKHNKEHAGNDFLRVTKSAKKINGLLNVLRFKDKDTQQIIAYCPALDITGYGENENKASEMLKFSIQDFFDYLIDLSSKQIEVELRAIGWNHDKLHNKEYSKAYIDINGELKNFNAVDNKVEILTLEAA